jgi:nucleoside-diphosphate-sugar epimerase
MEAEQGLRCLVAETEIGIVITRPLLIYGPGVKANFAALMRAVRCGLPLPCLKNQRSLVGLDNLVDFILTRISHHNAANQTFLVSDGWTFRHQNSSASWARLWVWRRACGPTR